MPKGFSDQEKEMIRARLLEQGQRLFSAHGLKKTNIDELAAAAGISKGAFYLFYESKEACFMDVVEEVERQYRQEILAMIEQPGPSPRARLKAVFQKAFSLWKTIPVLQVFTRGDFDILARRIPADKLQEHLSSDRVFIVELVERLRAAGIPVSAPVEKISSLTYALLFASLHTDDLGPHQMDSTMDLLVELVAAYCLGEIATMEETP